MRNNGQAALAWRQLPECLFRWSPGALVLSEEEKSPIESVLRSAGRALVIPPFGKQEEASARGLRVDTRSLPLPCGAPGERYGHRRPWEVSLYYGKCRSPTVAGGGRVQAGLVVSKLSCGLRQSAAPGKEGGGGAAL